MTNSELTIGFIGAGNCGAALAKAVSGAGYLVRGIASLRKNSAEKLAALLPGSKQMSSDQLVAQCNLVFITTPDNTIKDVVEQQRWRNGQYVVYCSGALELTHLNFISKFGALRGCFHPLQSFSQRLQSNPFEGIGIGVEADPPLAHILKQLALRIGGSVIELKGVDRAIYHAAAIFVSNYVIALQVAATRLWASAGLTPESAQIALSPLTAAAVENIEQLPLNKALTGPIARGDTVTIEKQLAALSTIPELHQLYRNLGAELLNLELGHNDATKSMLETLVKGEPKF